MTTSTNTIHVGDNTDLILTDKLVQLGEMQETLAATKAQVNHTHNTFIQTLNTSITATASNGTFSVSPNVEFIDGGTYLLNLQYSTSSGLVDRSTYAFRYDTSKVIQSTTILANCYNGNDNFMASYKNGVLTFATSYTGSGTPTNLTIKVI